MFNIFGWASSIFYSTCNPGINQGTFDMYHNYDEHIQPKFHKISPSESKAKRPYMQNPFHKS